MIDTMLFSIGLASLISIMIDMPKHPRSNGLVTIQLTQCKSSRSRSSSSVTRYPLPTLYQSMDNLTHRRLLMLGQPGSGILEFLQGRILDCPSFAPQSDVNCPLLPSCSTPVPILWVSETQHNVHYDSNCLPTQKNSRAQHPLFSLPQVDHHLQYRSSP